MPTSLSKEHRKLLENTTTAARVRAESGCRAALEYLAVHEPEYRMRISLMPAIHFTGRRPASSVEGGSAFQDGESWVGAQRRSE